ncbi:MAG: hypothetical protein JXA67_19975 [Micromonosporaceae bacterium]|nr:hypothetical protein [Micromonosporaceae bacterium]
MTMLHPHRQRDHTPGSRTILRQTDARYRDALNPWLRPADPDPRHDEDRSRIRGLLQAAGMAPTTGDPDAVGEIADRRLPLATLLDLHPDGGSRSCCVTTIDDRGRLADRTPLRVLGWEPATPVTIAAIPTAGIILVRHGGPDRLTRQGHLRLPATIRHDHRLTGGERLLILIHPADDLLVAYTPHALDQMTAAYHTQIPPQDPS